MMLQSTEDVAEALRWRAVEDGAKCSDAVTASGLTPTMTTFEVWTVEGRIYRVSVIEILGERK